MTDIEKIRTEIQRRLKYTREWIKGDENRHSKQTFISKNYYKMKGKESAYDAILDFLYEIENEKVSNDLKEELC